MSLTFATVWSMIGGVCAIPFGKEMQIIRRKEFLAGMKAGMPVCIGYFSVSFGFGAMAVAQGLAIWQAILISASI